MIARFIAILATIVIFTASDAREFYQESAWQPRAHPSVVGALSGKFHPASSLLSRPVTYETPGFAADWLHAARFMERVRELEPKIDRLVDEVPGVPTPTAAALDFLENHFAAAGLVLCNCEHGSEGISRMCDAER
jgi:hypothetical protein